LVPVAAIFSILSHNIQVLRGAQGFARFSRQVATILVEVCLQVTPHLQALQSTFRLTFAQALESCAGEEKETVKSAADSICRCIIGDAVPNFLSVVTEKARGRFVYFFLVTSHI